MEITNAVLKRDQMVRLLKEFLAYHKTKNEKSLFSVQRFFKCKGLDVKLLLRMDTKIEGNAEQGFVLTIQFFLTTDCVCLRRNNYFWADKESTVASYIVTNEQELDAQLENMSDELIEQLNLFRVCSICRILYSDSRAEPSNCCINCMYDSMFYVADSSCTICCESIQPEDQTFSLTCAHIYHSNCILLHFIKTAKRECPLCREADTHQI